LEFQSTQQFSHNEIKFFLQVSDLLLPTYYAGNVLVSSHGWFIFGGAGNALITSQKLRSLDAGWETGPNLYDNRSLQGHCMVQVQ
jgi:hypothetical protein